MDVADIMEPAVSEAVGEEGAIEHGYADSNMTGNVEENKFQRAIAAWRSAKTVLCSSQQGANKVQAST
jgi:hypothetical protein